jgi:hypothetical protein
MGREFNKSSPRTGQELSGEVATAEVAPRIDHATVDAFGDMSAPGPPRSRGGLVAVRAGHGMTNGSGAGCGSRPDAHKDPPHSCGLYWIVAQTCADGHSPIHCNNRRREHFRCECLRDGRQMR